MFLTLIVIPLSLPSANRISWLWLITKLGHWPTRLIVLPAGLLLGCWNDADEAGLRSVVLVNESDERWPAPLLMAIRGAKVVGGR